MKHPNQLETDTITAPDGKRYEISTVRTLSGGGINSTMGMFAASDFDNLQAWPFETMVFSAESGKGLFHCPYETEAEARAGHQTTVDTVSKGLELPGETVEEPWGTPRITPEEWNAKKRGPRVLL